MDSIAVRQCTTCPNSYPRTPEFWHKKKGTADGLHNKCKVCRCHEVKEYRKNNPEAVRKTQRECYAKTGVQNRRNYVTRHPERVKATNRRYSHENRDKKIIYLQGYRANGRPEQLERERLWREQNPERYRVKGANRRARKRNAPGSYTVEDVAAKLELQGDRCYYCSANLAETGYHIDHKIPLSKGGPNWPANICCACPRCNLRKQDLDFWEFISRFLDAA